jgi:hypothetical protein
VVFPAKRVSLLPNTWDGYGRLVEPHTWFLGLAASPFGAFGRHTSTSSVPSCSLVVDEGVGEAFEPASALTGNVGGSRPPL